jgi:hypothetical protein
MNYTLRLIQRFKKPVQKHYCAECNKEIDRKEKVFNISGKFVHARVNCIWEFTKKRNIKLRNVESYPLKKFI